MDALEVADLVSALLTPVRLVVRFAVNVLDGF